MAYKCGGLWYRQASVNSEKVYFFPHSCEQWEIGTREDLLNLKADIEAMLKE